MGKKTSKNKVKKNSKHRQYHKLIRTRRRGLDLDQLQDDWKYVTKSSAVIVNNDRSSVKVSENPEEMTIEEDEDGNVNVNVNANMDVAQLSAADLVKALPSTRFNGRLMREEVANNGESYCFQCGRYFIDDITLKVHQRSKLHKKKAKLLSEPMYTQADAEAAVGMAPADNSRV